jgi:hypothetical protein
LLFEVDFSGLRVDRVVTPLDWAVQVKHLVHGPQQGIQVRDYVLGMRGRHL